MSPGPMRRLARRNRCFRGCDRRGPPGTGELDEEGQEKERHCQLEQPIGRRPEPGESLEAAHREAHRRIVEKAREPEIDARKDAEEDGDENEIEETGDDRIREKRRERAAAAAIDRSCAVGQRARVRGMPLTLSPRRRAVHCGPVSGRCTARRDRHAGLDPASMPLRVGRQSLLDASLVAAYRNGYPAYAGTTSAGLRCLRASLSFDAIDGHA